jgi:hypothetical protein
LGTQIAYDLIREKIPFIETDEYLAPFIEEARLLVTEGTIKRAVEAAFEND